MKIDAHTHIFPGSSVFLSFPSQLQSELKSPSYETWHPSQHLLPEMTSHALNAADDPDRKELWEGGGREPWGLSSPVTSLPPVLEHWPWFPSA